MSFPETVKAATIKDEIPLEDITEKTFALREKAAKLQKAVLEQAKSLKTSRLSFNTVALQHQDLELELKKSQTERDKQKDLYTSLMKAKIDTKIVIDSQKRIMDKYTFITEQLNSRPSTGKPRPLTGKQRPFTASNVRGGLFSSQHIIS